MTLLRVIVRISFDTMLFIPDKPADDVKALHTHNVFNSTLDYRACFSLRNVKD